MTDKYKKIWSTLTKIGIPPFMLDEKVTPILIDHDLEELWKTIFQLRISSLGSSNINTIILGSVLLEFLQVMHLPEKKMIPFLSDLLNEFVKENSISSKLLEELNSRLKDESLEGEISILGDFSSNSNERVYQAGEQYDLYKDLKDIVAKATSEVFIVDAFVDDSLYELYIDVIPNFVPVKILTKNPHPKFITVGKILKQKRPLEIKEHQSIHDRYIFVDGNCWMIGTSIKDAAKTKPTVIMKINAYDDLYKLYDDYFTTGTKII